MLVIGCGNAWCGDDAAGPLVVEALADAAGIQAVDASVDGLGVLEAMRGADHVVLVDAARTGAPAGTVHRCGPHVLASLGPPRALDTHRLRWDTALALARALLGDRLPPVEAILIEGTEFAAGADASPPVRQAVAAVATAISARTATSAR